MKVPTNKLRDAVRYYGLELEPIYGVDESKHLVFELTKHFFGFDRLKLVLEPDHRLTESEMLSLHFAVKDLKRHKPVQYITGIAHFSGHRFRVNPSVLIPRPETEQLVTIAVEFCQSNKEVRRILDVGTGSGCIAICLKNALPSVQVSACDISKEAINTAKINADELSAEVDFFECDIRLWTFGQQAVGYDLIVSNPPYVTESDKKLMKPNVLDWEPHTALFAPENDPLYFYRLLANFSMHQLNANGMLMVEINEFLGDAVKQLFDETGLKKATVITDIHGKERYVTAKK